MKIVIKIVITLFCLFQLTEAQTDINPLFADLNAYNFCNEILETDHQELIFLNIYRNFRENMPGIIIGPVDRTILPDSSYSNIYRFSKEGTLLSKVSIKSTDDLYYYGFKMIQLDNGKYLVAGDVATLIDNRYDVFFAIINEDVDSVEYLYRLEKQNTREELINAWQKSNGNIVLYYLQPNQNPSRESLIEFNIQGTMVGQYYYFNNGVYNQIYNYNAMFFNDVFYHKIRNSIVPHVVSIDANNQLSYDTFNYTHQFNFETSGIQYGDNYYIDGAQNGMFSLFKFNSNLDVTVLYADTNTPSYSNFVLKSISSVDSNYMYAAYSLFNVDTGGILVYNVQSNGTLNWKKEIRLKNYDLQGAEYNLVVQSILATKDKGCVITIGVLNSASYGDTYYLKLDSTGNFVSVFTGIREQNVAFNISSFRVYPNPSVDFLNIEALQKGEYEFVVFDALGKIVLKNSFVNNETVDISNLPKQNYFYSITNTKTQQTETGKFLKK